MRKRIRILVAEDDPSVRAALVGLIQAEARFELVGEVADAAAAVEVAARQRPDVAVVDVRMPRGVHARSCASRTRRMSASPRR